MKKHISIDDKRLREVLERMRGEGIGEAKTTDIIGRYMGGFHSNKGVPVNVSWNAQFGKYLKAHSGPLGIREVAAKEKVVVDGNPTSASKWDLNG